MKRRTLALALVAAAAVGAGAWYGSLDPETRGLLAHLPTNADVLAWPQPTRDAAFRAMDRLPVLAQAATIAPSAHPLPLPAGKPLEIPRIDSFMASQHMAGLVIVQDGNIRLEKQSQPVHP